MGEKKGKQILLSCIFGSLLTYVNTNATHAAITKGQINIYFRMGHSTRGAVRRTHVRDCVTRSGLKLVYIRTRRRRRSRRNIFVLELKIKPARKPFSSCATRKQTNYTSL